MATMMMKISALVYVLVATVILPRAICATRLHEEDVPEGHRLLAAEAISTPIPAIKGYATDKGTKLFSVNAHKADPSAFSESTIDHLSLSSVGLGTYVGEPNDDGDHAATAVIESVIKQGVNVIDSAINYRGQRAEKCVGQALKNLISQGLITREQVFVSTKVGFIPGDSVKKLSSTRVLTDWTTDYQASQKDAPPFPDKEVIGGKHCIAPACLDMSLKHSLENMNLETIDLLYLHNVGEQQVKLIGFKEASERLRQAFIFLEKCRREGKIRYYGISSLTSFRVDPSDKTYMSLRDIEQIAREAGGKSHGLRFIQLPVTVTMPEATTLVHQSGVSAVAKARELGLHVMSGSSRGLYSKFAANNQALAAYKTCKSSLGVSEELDTKLSAAALSLHLTRSLSSLSTAITGMKQEHIEEHMAVLNMPKESPRMLQCVITATTNQHTESEKSANLLLDINSPLDVDATIHKIQDTFQDTISSVKGSIGELGHLGGMDGSMMQGGFAGVTNSISAGAKALYQKAVNFEEGLEHQIGAGHIMHDSLGSVQRGVDMVKASAQSLYNQAIATEHQIGETASVAGAELNELAHEKLAQAHNALEVIQQDVRQAPQFDQVVQDINNKVNTVRDTLSVDALERDMRAVAEGIEQHVSKFGKQGARHPNMSSELKAQMNQHSGFAQMLGMRDRDREGGGHEHSRTEQKMEELKEQRRQKRANLRRNGRAES